MPELTLQIIPGDIMALLNALPHTICVAMHRMFFRDSAVFGIGLVLKQKIQVADW